MLSVIGGRDTMNEYKLKVNINWLRRKRTALMKQLANARPFVNGSVVKIARTCGNKEHCRCSKGFLHESYFLTHSVKGKTHTIYIPVDLEDEVKEWSKEYKRIKNLMKEMSRCQRAIIRRYVKEKRLKKGRS